MMMMIDRRDTDWGRGSDRNVLVVLSSATLFCPRSSTVVGGSYYFLLVVSAGRESLFLLFCTFVI